MPFGGLLTMGIVGAVGSIGGATIGAIGAKNAASQQAQAEQNALDFQKQMWGDEQQNMSPYLSMGNTGVAALMAALGNGTFGPGSMPAMPQFTGTFTAPSLEEAQQTPGYQFTAQQGSKGILQGAAAAGGAISGGTLKALDQYNTNLANTTYNDVFNRALQTYGTGLQAYQANLGGYQANLGRQAQMFNEMLAPVTIGENAAAGLNATGQGVAVNAGNLMGGIGNANAAGTVGMTNSITSGLTGASNSLMQSILLSKMLGTPANGAGAPNSGYTNPYTSIYYPPGTLPATAPPNSGPIPG
jgi:hypothetical protein